ncbi:hypothetical protein Thein_1777 [Thermodesulfatator indicus DSM 15286]|uniref:rRNA small subunit methyltransferase F RNA-binding PUA-like domain-containing protein n=1 Tax=Thermodesulfatator indicus (strain DSM 15286 / JCM 11887 / CIR29812) TaxID=667014 RepID=F8ABN2_THEID|nr:hypothetical protein [Thermodesulfatator indicus]AEH45633.1 hypothetical protein Thein_1777 [Thermodesulfatator indicus DSM 15286]
MPKKKQVKKIHKEAKWPRVTSFEERDEVLSFWEERFGIPKNAFSGYLLLSTSKNYWLFVEPPEIKPLQGLKVQTVGLLFTRRVSRWLKPTSTALQRFGHLATKNIIDLTPAELDRLRREKKISFSAQIEEGYVILRCEQKVWGCGLYAKESLISFLP